MSDLTQHLSEIRTQCLHITNAVLGLSRQDFADDIIIRSGVERFVINIGITATQIRELYPKQFDELEGLRLAIGVRNRLAHGYGDDIDEDVVWNIARHSIPFLLTEIDSKR